MQLIIENGRCRCERGASLKFFTFKSLMEGGARMNKEGVVSFADSGHNLDIWKRAFPDSEIVREKAIDDGLEDVERLMRPNHVFKRSPKEWQDKADKKLDILIEDASKPNAFAFLFDPGAGKSLSLTNMATKLYCNGSIDAVIIVTPNMLVAKQWAYKDTKNDMEGGALQRDIQPDIEWNCWLWDKTKRGQSNYNQLKNFDGLRFVVLNVDAVKTPAGKTLLNDFINHHKGRVLFGLDEAHMAANVSSQRHKACVELAHKCKWRAALTGTPITKDIMSVFGVFRFLDSRIFGYKFATGFKNEYAQTIWNGFAEEIVGYKNLEKLYSKIDPYSARVNQEEMGLSKIYDNFVFEMYPEQLQHFERLKKEWTTSLDNGEFTTVSIAMTAAMRMQQVTNGFLVGDDGTVQYLKNARMDALNSLVETLSDDKLVIWCRFKIDAQLLMSNFGDNAVDLSGNVDSSQRSINKDRFISDPSIRFMIATPDAAGTGMDGVQHATNRAIYYSTSEHYVNRKQSEDRILRVGGGSVAFYHNLICQGSPDKKIASNLQKKNDLSKLTMDEIRKLYYE